LAQQHSDRYRQCDHGYRVRPHLTACFGQRQLAPGARLLTEISQALAPFGHP
jgi:hypothetical protein